MHLIFNLRSSFNAKPRRSTSARAEVAESSEPPAAIATTTSAPPPATVVAPASSKRRLLFRNLPSSTSVTVPSNATDPVMRRKIWVRRPGASPTIVTVEEDDLVDNVRDQILHKYSNSLGKSIDSPDITLKIITREQANKGVSNERALGPEESIGRTLDAYYPGGQTVDEALIIEVPQRRTPKPSPRVGNHQVPYYLPEEYRPGDGAREYFPPMAPPLNSPHQGSHPQYPNSSHPSVHAMAVLTTGQLPPLPSPGAHSTRRHARPKYGRQHTSSPTILHSTQPSSSVIDPKTQTNGATATTAAPLPTPPAQNTADQHKPSITPPNRTLSPHPGQRVRRGKIQKGSNANTARSMNGDPPPAPKPASASLLDGSVPPINVLIVEDNIINLKLLEAFMKRLKVRWKSAMNGKEAVAMWRTGGFHLVLMDIQLPVMNGLDATKEIRRLEGVNGIGVFSGSPIEGMQTVNGNSQEAMNGAEDNLGDRSLFKSPVIIVALTASSLQSDRHEALAAGCNDFLTKPVNFVWMERKVTEWGCMQALIDYDGWRKWKEYGNAKEKDPAAKEREEREAKAEKAKSRAQLKAFFSRPPPSVPNRDDVSPGVAAAEKENKEEAEKAKGKPKDKEKEKEKQKDDSFPLASPLGNGGPVGGGGGSGAGGGGKKVVGNPGRSHAKGKGSAGSATLGPTPEGDESVA